MRTWAKFCVLMALTLAGAGCAANKTGDQDSPKSKQAAGNWRDNFTADKANLVNVGRNPYFILEPGYKLYYESPKGKLVITVLNETKLVDGVQTRVIEEREDEDGKLIEVSRNYFVIDKTTSDLFYFGEDVDMYKNGKIINHEGSWLSGVNGAKFGMMMPGQPKVGDKFYQEVAPKVAQDRCEIVSVDHKQQTPASNFEKCVKTDETSPLESGTAHKVYAPGVGLVSDAEFVLVRIEKP